MAAKAKGIAYCPVHGQRTQDGHGHGWCNEIVRRDHGIPILCGRSVSKTEQRIIADPKLDDYTLTSAQERFWGAVQGKVREVARQRDAYVWLAFLSGQNEVRTSDGRHTVVYSTPTWKYAFFKRLRLEWARRRFRRTGRV